jgi:hypothetical protein
MLLSKWYIKLMLNNVNKTNDIYDFCLNNPKICAKNKNLVCKKILISSGYKKFLNKNYCLIFKELLNIKKRIKFNCRNDISMTQVLWNYCKIYGSIELKHFININKPNNIIDYQYEDIFDYGCIRMTDTDKTTINTIITLDKIYSEISLI